jgi:heat shock protein HslJ
LLGGFFVNSGMRLIFLLLLFAACKPSHQIRDLVGVPKERPLENTYWVLTELDGKPIATIIEAKKIHLQLNPVTKTASGFAGCNQFTGSYTLEGKKLGLNGIASTRMFCLESMEVETRFIQVLQEVNEFRIKEHELFLSKDDQQLAKFQAEIQPGN